MKTRLFISALIALLSVAIYPLTEQLANAERGYANRIDNVFGGEEMLLILGLFISVMIIVNGVDNRFTERVIKEYSLVDSQGDILQVSDLQRRLIQGYFLIIDRA